MKADTPLLTVYDISPGDLENVRRKLKTEGKILFVYALGCLIYMAWNAYFLTPNSSGSESFDIFEAAPHSYFIVALFIFTAAHVMRCERAQRLYPIKSEDLPVFHGLIEKGLRDEERREQVLHFFQKLESLDRLPVYGDMRNLQDFHVNMGLIRTKEEADRVSHTPEAKEWRRIKESIADMNLTH